MRSVRSVRCVRCVRCVRTPISTPLPASTNFVGDIGVGLGCNEHFNAFGATVACCGEHRSPAKLWAHNTTHRRESVRHCMAPKGTRHGCTDKGQCGYGCTNKGRVDVIRSDALT